MDQHDAAVIAAQIQTNIHQVIVGKEAAVELLLVALAAGGHVLLEDVPGTGKTTMAKALARSLDVTFRRLQFTPDLLPSDVTGLSHYQPQTGEFNFRPGPVFTHVLLADEINRATPRTQSALLEAMEERQVTVEGVSRALSAPFLVIATQNPVEQEGTFPLPEAQLDRFLLKLPTGYPTDEEEMAILDRFKSAQPSLTLQPVAAAAAILQLQEAVPAVHVSRPVQQYLVDIARATRHAPGVELGVSPRATLALMRASQALAVLRSRSHVLPDDVQHLAIPVLGHRIILSPQSRLRGQGPDAVLDHILAEMPVPAEPLTEGGTMAWRG